MKPLIEAMNLSYEEFAAATAHLPRGRYIVEYDHDRHCGSVRIDLRYVIRERIKLYGVTMEELAAAAGTNQPTLSMYLGGKRPLPHATLERVLAVLELL